MNNKYFECKACHKVMQAADDVAATMDAQADGCPKMCNLNELNVTDLSDTQKLLLNLSSGLDVEDLSTAQVELLETTLGTNWFDKLGYKEPEHTRPKTA